LSNRSLFSRVRAVAVVAIVSCIMDCSLSLIAEQGAAGNSSQPWMKERTILFPADHSIGMLIIRKWDPPYRNPDEDLAKASGDVHVRAGYMLGLEIEKAKPVDLSPLAKFAADDLQNLYLYRTQVKNSDLQHIRHLTGLMCIDLSITGIGDEGLKYCGGLKNVTELNLSRTKISDPGIFYLRGLYTLHLLLLKNTAITDASIKYLKELTSLEILSIRNSKISPQGVAALKTALPKCRIDHDIETKFNSAWSDKLGGILCNLGAQQIVWDAGEDITLAIKVYNASHNEILSATDVTICEIEVDGKWHRWTGNAAYIISFPLKPGMGNAEQIQVPLLSRCWASKETGRQLELVPGKHTIRALYRSNPALKDISMITGPLEIKIRSKGKR
jgi:hypothetical protein